jgi:hypothetical protein
MATSIASSQKSVWGFSPQSIPGLALWLDGADTTSITGTSSSVTAWRDKSGNGYSAVPHSGTIAQTTLNGQNALNFGTSIMRVPSFTWTSSFTQFFVAYASSTNGIIIDTATSGGVQYGDYVYTGNGNLMNINNPANTGILQVNDTVAGSVQPNNTWFIFCIGYGSTGTVAINYTLNGTVRSTTASPATPPYAGGSATNPPLTLYINGVASGATLGSGVQIAELIHFNTDITATQRQQVEGYLAAKWGLKANLLATHPYSTGSIIPFNRPFYPVDIPGCAMWFDAADNSTITLSGSTVTQWNDKSGNGYNATNSTYAAPTYSATGFNNGYPGLLFNGTSTMLATPSILPTPVLSANGTDTTIFLVFNRISQVANFIAFGLGGAAVSTNYNTYVLRDPWSSTTGALLDIGNGTLGRVNIPSYTVTGPQLYSLWRNGTSTYFYRYGSSLGSNLSASSNVGTTNQPLNIGGGFADGGWFNSYISEFIIFNTALSTSQRQQVEQYLTWKWGLSIVNLPTGHPGKLLPAFSTNFTVKSISGCQLWLDAADSSTVTGTSTVTAWADKSGNGNNGTATGSPTLAQNSINGRQAVTAAVGTYFLGPLAISGPSLTCFAIATTNVTLPNIRSPRADQRLVSLANGANRDYDGTGGVIPLFNWDNTSMIGAYNNNLGNVNSNTIVTGTPFMAVSRFDGTTASLWFNGAPGSFPSSPSTNSFTITKYGIGNQANPTIEYWSGFIGEIILFSTALTTSQRQQVEGYLAWKWGLQSSLPSTHAYAKFSP